MTEFTYQTTTIRTVHKRTRIVKGTYENKFVRYEVKIISGGFGTMMSAFSKTQLREMLKRHSL